ncbi:MAG: glycoside hydrolase family 36 N-terminal domain-containing protein, partial [Actinomycetota bacterium]
MSNGRSADHSEAATEVVVLQSGSTQLVLDLRQPMPVIVHLGPPIPAFDPQLLDQPVAHATLDSPAPLGIITEHGYGFGGRPGLMGHRGDGSGWSPLFTEADQPVIGGPAEQPSSARFSIVDPVAELRLGLEVSVTEAETVVISAELTNEGDSPYALLRLAPSVPVPIHAVDLVTFSGRWCREFQPDRSSFDGLTVLENRRGRTSHEQLPAVFAGTFGFGEDHGDVWGVQLAWSGNY